MCVTGLVLPDELDTPRAGAVRDIRRLRAGIRALRLRAWPSGEQRGAPLRRHRTIRHRRQHGVPPRVLRAAKACSIRRSTSARRRTAAAISRCSFACSSPATRWSTSRRRWCGTAIAATTRRSRSRSPTTASASTPTWFARRRPIPTSVSPSCVSALWWLWWWNVRRLLRAIAAAPRLSARSGPGRVQGLVRRLAPLRRGPPSRRRRAPPVRAGRRAVERHRRGRSLVSAGATADRDQERRRRATRFMPIPDVTAIGMTRVFVSDGGELIGSTDIGNARGPISATRLRDAIASGLAYSLMQRARRAPARAGRAAAGSAAPTSAFRSSSRRAIGRTICAGA